jgi:hypothetical protein
MQKLEHTTISIVLTSGTQSALIFLRGDIIDLWALFTLGLYPFLYYGGRW